MFRTLNRKLALTLFIVMLGLGLVGIQGLLLSTERYHQEVEQKLNASLAAHIVAADSLLHDNRINQQALEHFFHMAMEINPAIELYLLDPDGRILSYHAPEGRVVRDRIGLESVKQFIAGEGRYPLSGDDPRHADRKKVFSAARIPRDGPLQGYLYIILGSEKYDTIAQWLQESLTLKLGLLALVASLLVALLAGTGMFHLLTKRLRALASDMERFQGRHGDVHADPAPGDGVPGDELDILADRFRRMAARIEQQLNNLKHNDRQRREMIANVSHDLRTPLTTMHGYLETLLLRMDRMNTEEQTAYLNVAIRHSQRLRQLVDELFELARLESCETVATLEPFPLGDLMQDVAQKFRLRAQQNRIHLEFVNDPSAAWVNGDIAMIQRVLENLLENALNHTPPGGSIRLGFATEGNQVIVTVQDSGRGMHPEELQHVFERFYRVEKSRTAGNGGAGLGLSIAKRIIDLHGGSISVQSAVNRGTTFTFPIPLHQAK